MNASVPYTREQNRHLAEAAEAWERHSALLRERAALVGGMQWKTLGGHDYLYRYMPDPLTRKKRSTSLGRRSPETELAYRNFLQRREIVSAAIERDEPRMAMQARMAKALHLARVPNDDADVLRVLWLSEIAEHMVLMSSQALFAFESVFGGSIEFEADGHLQFLFRDDHLVEEMTDALRLALIGFDRTATVEPIRSGLRAEGRKIRTIHFVKPSYLDDLLERHAGGRVLHAAREMLGYESVPALAFSRSGESVPVVAVDPRACVACSFLLDDEVPPEIRLLAALAHDSDRFRFEGKHLEAMPNLVEIIDDTQMRGPRI